MAVKLAFIISYEPILVGIGLRKPNIKMIKAELTQLNPGRGS